MSLLRIGRKRKAYKIPDFNRLRVIDLLTINEDL